MPVTLLWSLLMEILTGTPAAGDKFALHHPLREVIGVHEKASFINSFSRLGQDQRVLFVIAGDIKMHLETGHGDSHLGYLLESGPEGNVGGGLFGLEAPASDLTWKMRGKKCH